MKRRALIILVLAFCHYMALWIMSLMAFRMSMGRFDRGDPPPTQTETVLWNVVTVMNFPVYPISMRIGLGWLYPVHIMLGILGSILWASLLYLLFTRLLGFRRRPDRVNHARET